MKITLEVSDSLLREARELAAREGSASFKGKGRQELSEASWETLCDIAYRGRGA
jgi:hypothetical protein